MSQNSSTPAQHADKQQNRTKPYRNYKPTGVMGLFDEQEREARQRQQPKLLDRLSEAVNFEMFRPTLERHVLNPARKSPAGARRYDPVLMFKVLVLQQVYGYSDLKTEEMLDDSTSHRRFVGLASGDEIPDQKSIWLFRDTLTKSGAIEVLFKQLDGILHAKGLIINRGQSVDASFADVPRQHNTP